MTVRELLTKYKMLDDNIKRISFHLGVLSSDPKELVFRILKEKEMKEPELAVAVFTLILRCDVNNPEYDAKLDEEMVRFCLKTDKFPSNNHNSPSNNLDEMNEMLSDRIDNQTDFQNDVDHYK